MNYDGANNLTDATAAGGQSLTFGLSGGRLGSATDNASHAFDYAYNPTTGDLTSITDPLGLATAFSYSSHRLSSVTDPRSKVTQIAYDDNSRVQSITVDGTLVASFTYNGDLTTMTDGNNHAMTYAFSPPVGLVAQRVDALVQTTTYAYDAGFNVIAVTDPLSRTTKSSYDSLGNLTAFTDTMTQTTSYEYNSTNDLVSVTDPLSRITRYAYDGLGNLTVITDAKGYTTTYGYNGYGQRTSVTDAHSHTTRYGYNAAGYVITTTDALNHLTQYGYDAVGNRTVITDARSNVTTIAYDAANRLLSTTIPLTSTDTATTYYGYDGVGNRTVVTDAMNSVSRYAYDALNRVISTTLPLTGTQTALTRYGYDAVGNRTVITDANSHVTRYGYDALNRTTVITDAATNATRYGYDAVSNRTVVTDALTNTTRYDYDNLSRVITITNPLGKKQRYSHDAVGNTLFYTDELTQTTRYAYDELNRVISTTNPLTQTTRYGYDKVGNTTVITGSTGITTTLTYWENNWLKTKRTSIGTTQYAYDDVGNLSTLTEPSGATQNFVYDKANRAVREQDRDSGGNLIVTYLHAYDANSNRTSETEARPGKPDRVTSYAYNKANWLITVTDPNSSMTTYSYDAVGNQTGVIEPSGYSTAVSYTASNLPSVTTISSGGVIVTTTNSYDSRNLLSGWTTSESPYNLALTTTLQYNANGYLTNINNSNQGYQYSSALTSTVIYQNNDLVSQILEQGKASQDAIYDAAGRLVCYNENRQPADAYLEYDASGRRTVRLWNFTNNYACADIVANHGAPAWKISAYSYDGNRLIGEVANIYTRTHSYDNDGNLTQAHRIDAVNLSTITLNYTWEPGTHRMTGLERLVNGSPTYTATLDYDRSNRITQFCWSGGGCHNFSYVGESDWLSVVKDQAGNVVQRYVYANGRPVRVDIPPWPSYYRYDYHGNAAGMVGVDGNGGAGWTGYGAWGDLYSVLPSQYYNWNAGWGYMRFPDVFNFGVNDAIDGGLYFVHGRWYNQDTGLFLSPDEKGEYFYGSGNGNDPVDYALAQTTQQGFSREDIINFASVERQLISLLPMPPFNFGRLSIVSASALAAYEAVGEAATMCQPGTQPADCRRAFGAIALAIQNRYELCSGNTCAYLAPPHATRSEIIIAGCSTGHCSQFEGLEHWIRIESGRYQGLCNVGNPSECFDVSNQGRQRQLNLAFDAALSVFSGGYKTDRDLSPFLDRDVGKRVYFATTCGGIMPPTVRAGASATPGPTQCNWVDYAGHFFWGP